MPRATIKRPVYSFDPSKDEAAEPAQRPATPSETSETAMYWPLNQRIDNTEKQIQELSIESERKVRYIQAMIQHLSQSLLHSQRQTQEDVRNLREELSALQKQVEAPEHRHPVTQAEQPSKNTTTTDLPGVTFQDESGYSEL